MKGFRIFIGLLAIIVGLTTLTTQQAQAGWFTSSGNTSSDRKMSASQEQMIQQINQMTGLPSIVNGFEKRMVRMLYELRDNPEFRTYSYIVTMDGTFIKVCDSIGFGINASIQYSNPQKVYHGDGPNGKSATFISQAEPNGLFMPEGLSATYVMCVNPEKEELQPVYVEPEVVVSPFPMTN